MSGVCIDKLPHKCGTKKGLQVFVQEDGTVDGFCFSCATRVDHPYGEPKTVKDVDLPKPKTEKEIQAEIAEIIGLPTVDLPSRKLRAKYLDQLGIKVGLSEQDGKTPAVMYTPVHKEGKLSGYYAKTLIGNKMLWSIGDVKGGEPIGWQEARKSGGYRLIITEGPEDAAAVLSIFDRYGDDKYMPSVISLPNGVNSVKSSLTQISEEASRIFKEIVIVFDNDDKGQSAVEDAMVVFPKAMTVTLPEKDANDCILKGAQKAAHRALAFQASAPKNTRIIIADGNLHASARKPTPRGELTWPWMNMDNMMRGVRLGETIYIGAGVKMGKSSILDALVSHFIEVHKVKCFVAKPEEENEESYKRIAGKIVGHDFMDPDIPFNYDKYDEAGEILQGNLYMVDLYQHLGWDSLKKDIIMAANLGAKAVFIDPITNLTAGMKASEANDFLAGMTRDLSAMAKDLDIVVFLFVHLKAPEGNLSADKRAAFYAKGKYHQLGSCPHERGGSIYSNQFAGSRAMMQSCNLMLGLEGNKDEDLPEEIRNTRWLTILEDRAFGNSSSVMLHYNKNTTQFKEVG